MSQLAISSPSVSSSTSSAIDASGAARYAVPAGRALFALLFVILGMGHFNDQMVGYAAAMGVPMASFLVPASGVLAIAGALSVAFGYRARLGALALIAFLVPVTFSMHRFWAAPDAMAAMNEKIAFLKNLGLVGGALLIAYFGAGPVSLDARRNRA